MNTNDKSGWISVEDRLPTEKDGDKRGQILCTNIAFTQIVQWDFKYLKTHMTHWMSLPQPPQTKN